MHCSQSYTILLYFKLNNSVYLYTGPYPADTTVTLSKAMPEAAYGNQDQLEKAPPDTTLCMYVITYVCMHACDLTILHWILL